MERKTGEDVVMRTLNKEVGGHRKIGTPKLRWSKVIRKYTKEKQVGPKDRRNTRPDGERGY